jgi:molybdopterin-binding protein
MKLGARNAIKGTVTTVKSDTIMSLIKFEVSGPIEMASVITTESLEAMNLKPGDTVELVVKAIHVLPIKP